MLVAEYVRMSTDQQDTSTAIAGYVAAHNMVVL
jgi:hypothetical protein